MNILFCGGNQHYLLQPLSGAGYQLVTTLTTVKPEHHGSSCYILHLVCSRHRKSTYFDFRERKKGNKKEKSQTENRFQERSTNHCDPANHNLFFDYILVKKTFVWNMVFL